MEIRRGFGGTFCTVLSMRMRSLDLISLVPKPFPGKGLGTRLGPNHLNSTDPPKVIARCSGVSYKLS